MSEFDWMAKKHSNSINYEKALTAGLCSQQVVRHSLSILPLTIVQYMLT